MAHSPDGRADGFESFYVRLWPTTCRLGAVLTGHVDIGEDIAQEAFLRVRERFDSLDTPEAYIRRTLINLAKTEATSAARRHVREARAAAHGVSSATELRDEVVLDAMKRLPFEQRSALVLRYWADWCDESIAEALGCRRATVRSHVRRGLMRLRAELEDKE